ncbi:MAG: alanine-glyoxylate transaminase/serine-glyoxylate transaminase/serine-pyruvate transaminase [bacterium]|jgi:alanine-glyoxylate transaminase/serine-glyoxylate transaminase/serine-pyruvate transaminase
MTVSFPPPQSIPLSDILPTEPLLLMGAGPVPIPYAVARANSVVINHLGETMDMVIQRVKMMARYAFQTQNDKIIGISGPSSAAMEMGISNLLWKGRTALILKNGTFSGRFGEMAEGVGADVTILEAPIAKPITLEMVEEAFQKQHYDVVTIAQGETSCGVYNFHLPEIAKFAKSKGSLVIVDAVCTLTTMPLFMDAWGIDVAITGGQKGLSSIPGVSLIAFSREAWNVVESRELPQTHWCFDALRAQRFWGHQQYHYTAPVPGILAIHEALRLICEETLESRFKRHTISSKALQSGITAMGLELFVEEKQRLNSVVAIKIPEGVDGEKARKFMRDYYLVEISGAFGLDIVRIGQMGEQCRSHNLFKVLFALGMSFQEQGIKLDVSSGMAVMEQALADDTEHFVR